MDELLGEDASATTTILAVAAVALVVLAVLFLLLWVRTARGRRRESGIRAESERSQLSLELLLAEQTARLRMVRELNELASNSVSAIARQADGARYAGESDPGAVVRSAVAIAEAARATLDDLRRITDIVKHGEADAGAQPGIRTARELFRVMREAGLEIRFEETGERFPLRSGAELAIYRILQESLSNALKYGGEGTAVTVAFRWSEQGVRVLIDDDGIRAAARRDDGDPNASGRARGYTVEDDAAALTSGPTGPGITEMRERAELFGGVFHAETVPGVGFSVAVTFPALRSGPLAERDRQGQP
ncbi:MAG TPA: ATP-binding protein [Homoserinimonas sp.]|nr:ATP-binding protein [Homoserinimonas sp.]